MFHPWREAHRVQTNCRARVSLILLLLVSREEEDGEEGGQDEDKREQPTLHISGLDNLPGFCSSAIEIHMSHDQF